MTDTLIHRLEAAEGPSRELDARIQCAIQGLYFGRHCSGRTFKARRIFKDGRVKDQLENFKSQHYTASLDAAVSLVPEKALAWKCGKDLISKRSYVAVLMPMTETLTGGELHSVAPTPALALCIAALKAREAGDG